MEISRGLGSRLGADRGQSSEPMHTFFSRGTFSLLFLSFLLSDLFAVSFSFSFISYNDRMIDALGLAGITRDIEQPPDEVSVVSKAPSDPDQERAQ
jgi:hypothetical protein